MNLIPAHRRLAANRRRRIKRWFAGGGIYALLMLVICTIVQLGRGGENATAMAINNVQQRSISLQADINAARGELIRALAARDTLSSLADPPDWALLLAGLPTSAGTETMIREIHLDAPAAANLSEQPKIFEMHLRGLCESQATVKTLLTQLQSLGMFSQVQLLRSGREPYGAGSAVAFDVKCVIGGSVADATYQGNDKP